MSSPHYCRPEAYRLFAGSLPELETTSGLIQAAMSLSLGGVVSKVPVPLSTWWP